MLGFPLSFLPVVYLGVALAPAEDRAIAYLAAEVPRWSAENRCYSCHNNGDAVRALCAARRLSFRVPAKSLSDSASWLVRPAKWEENAGKDRGGDRALARVQFATALAALVEAGVTEERQSLREAAEILVADQQKDGSWKVDAGGTAGAPATYGACLATVQARGMLRQADAARYRSAVSRAEEWLARTKPASVLDAAAILLGLQEVGGDAAAAQRRRCLEILVKAQGKDGGWGPYRTSASEPFDTAVAVLALCLLEDREAKEMARRGRAYLVAAQKRDGSWPETTRPAEGESYAERISTTAWATLALLATREK